ncbi:elongation factor P hydroxylase [Bowmanella pacifica]|uniref:Elongation factor P hydroxylase n=1 Tax=Bowmanella pacifica TaxID=502051 RepID=A0A918DLC8_9ALTE|nr:elongation factor P hydroxylase [Bowmanella pacifica]
MSDIHQVEDLITLFNGQFAASFNTRLVRGEHEPLYLPANSHTPYHQVIFAHGYYASALHEIAHWCLAGAKRRELEDYGYWYCPDGRDAVQQAEFEKVEIKPQAIEWGLCAAAGKAFRVSTDNLNGVEPDRAAFSRAVQAQALSYLANGFPPRARQFMQCLQQFYATPILSPANFTLEPAHVL